MGKRQKENSAASGWKADGQGKGILTEQAGSVSLHGEGKENRKAPHNRDRPVGAIRQTEVPSVPAFREERQVLERGARERVRPAYFDRTETEEGQALKEETAQQALHISGDNRAGEMLRQDNGKEAGRSLHVNAGEKPGETLRTDTAGQTGGRLRADDGKRTGSMLHADDGELLQKDTVRQAGGRLRTGDGSRAGDMLHADAGEKTGETLQTDTARQTGGRLRAEDGSRAGSMLHVDVGTQAGETLRTNMAGQAGGRLRTGDGNRTGGMLRVDAGDHTGSILRTDSGGQRDGKLRAEEGNRTLRSNRGTGKAGGTLRVNTGEQSVGKLRIGDGSRTGGMLHADTGETVGGTLRINSGEQPVGKLRTGDGSRTGGMLHADIGKSGSGSLRADNGKQWGKRLRTGGGGRTGKTRQANGMEQSAGDRPRQDFAIPDTKAGTAPSQRLRFSGKSSKASFQTVQGTGLRFSSRQEKRGGQNPAALSLAGAGRNALRFLERAAESGEENGTQDAWLDVAGRMADAGIFSLSRTAKYWRQHGKGSGLPGKMERPAAYRVRQDGTAVRQAVGAGWKEASISRKRLYKKTVKRRYMREAVRQSRMAKQAGELSYTTGMRVRDRAASFVKAVASKVVAGIRSPAVAASLACFLMAGLTASVTGTAGVFAFLSFGNSFSEESTQGAGFPEAVEQWRTFVAERLKAYGYPDFVQAILATIQQESGGDSKSSGGDIMQCKESGYWSSGTPEGWDNYTDEQKSIDAGCRYFIDGLKNWQVTKADDYDGLQVVAQGYNYGWGFLDYMRQQKATAWTLELSSAYSDQRAAALGWKSYGHKPYGREWLEKYKAGAAVGGGAVVVESGAGGVVKTAQGQIGITEDPAGSNSVIYNTEYYGTQVSETPDGAGGYSTCNYPWCCTFVWWVFQKSGNGAAFYGGEKVAGCAAVHAWAQNNGCMISGADAGYGDIVLFGSDEHIEIVVANNGDGTYTTIGGNTSSEDTGSQSNGGGVFLRTRSADGNFPITAFIRPKY